MSLAQETTLTRLAGDRRAFFRLPELAGAPVTFRAALRIIARNWMLGSVTFVMPSGRELEIAGAEPGLSGRLIVRDFRFMHRVLATGDIGFAEGFMAGEWDTPDLPALLCVFAANWPRLPRVTTRHLRGAVQGRQAADVRPGPERARRHPLRRLPRRRGPLRPGGLHRDVRGGGRALLASLLRQDPRNAGTWRPRRPADHHHPRRGFRGLPRPRGLHPEIHLPRRHAAVRGEAEKGHRQGRPRL